MEKRAFYFGCIDHAGHYLHKVDGPRTLYDMPPGMPWNLGHMDTGLLKNGNVPDHADGKVYWTCGGRDALWFAFFWWDNSVDRRGGSNSGFYVSGFASGQAQDAFNYACEAWPAVVKRQQHQLALRPYTPLHDLCAQAADEIERLRADAQELHEIQQMAADGRYSLEAIGIRVRNGMAIKN